MAPRDATSERGEQGSQRGQRSDGGRVCGESGARRCTQAFTTLACFMYGHLLLTTAPTLVLLPQELTDEELQMMN